MHLLKRVQKGVGTNCTEGNEERRSLELDIEKLTSRPCFPEVEARRWIEGPRTEKKAC